MTKSNDKPVSLTPKIDLINMIERQATNQRTATALVNMATALGTAPAESPDLELFASESLVFAKQLIEEYTQITLAMKHLKARQDKIRDLLHPVLLQHGEGDTNRIESLGKGQAYIRGAYSYPAVTDVKALIARCQRNKAVWHAVEPFIYQKQIAPAVTVKA